MTSYLAGLGLMLSLIVAIGAQNLFVLRQGVRREYVWLVVAICAVSDAVLVCAGVAGVGAVVTSHPAVLTAVRWAGAAFLLVYGLLAAKRAWRLACGTLGGVTDFGSLAGGGVPCPEARKGLKNRRPVSSWFLPPGDRPPRSWP